MARARSTPVPPPPPLWPACTVGSNSTCRRTTEAPSDRTQLAEEIKRHRRIELNLPKNYRGTIGSNSTRRGTKVHRRIELNSEELKRHLRIELKPRN
eukprot:2490476-Pyramimonas_sp.AAC.1